MTKEHTRANEWHFAVKDEFGSLPGVRRISAEGKVKGGGRCVRCGALLEFWWNDGKVDPVDGKDFN